MKEGGKPTLVPKLRFPAFREEHGWKVTKLNAISDPVIDRAIQGEREIVLSLSAEYGIVLQSDFFGKKVAGENSERYTKITRNDFVYNDRTTKASTFGTIKRLSKHAGGIVSPIYKCFRFRETENPVFWEWYFESGNHNVALAGLVNEGARAGRFNISITQFLSTQVWQPSESEQQRIAECLSSADEAIAAQARKVDALKKHKKGLMQQLFPREGETQPRLRFPQFQNAGAWANTTLRMICQRIMDGTHFSPRTKEGPRPYLTSKNIRMGWLDLSTITFIAEDEHRSIYARCPVKKNDVLLTKDGANTGNCAINTIDEEFSLLSSVAVLRGDPEQIIQQFLYQSIASDGMQSRIVNSMSGQAITRITLEKLGNYEILIPNISEQQYIADLLSSLDTLFIAETQKLEALKTHKRGLMQQLFPSPKEAKK